MHRFRWFLMRPVSDSSPMGTQNECDIKRSKTISIAGNYHFKTDTQSETSFQSEHTIFSLKVRKPYTITKKREKWSEEEHRKFLEALKLYGRGWHQIEEHVGTKTAVQIRSHAQKFFAKLERESNGSAENSIQSIVFPPPRPKRKPLHPYPRKPVDCSHGSSILNEQERSPSPNMLVPERETRSPTSILSRLDSESYESAIQEQTVRSLSPSSGHTEMHSVRKSNIEKDDDYMTSNSSEEGKASWLSVPQCGGASLENLFSMKFESNSVRTESSKEASANNQPSTGIKLFGKTIFIYEKPWRVDEENLVSVASMHGQGNHVVDKEQLGLETQPHLDVHLSLGMSCSNSNSPSGGDNMNSMEDQKEMLFNVGSVAKVSLPGWTFHKSLSALNSEPFNKFETPTPLHDCLRKGWRTKKESSFTGSCSATKWLI